MISIESFQTKQGETYWSIWKRGERIINSMVIDQKELEDLKELATEALLKVKQ